MLDLEEAHVGLGGDRRILGDQQALESGFGFTQVSTVVGEQGGAKIKFRVGPDFAAGQECMAGFGVLSCVEVEFPDFLPGIPVGLPVFEQVGFVIPYRRLSIACH